MICFSYVDLGVCVWFVIFIAVSHQPKIEEPANSTIWCVYDSLNCNNNNTLGHNTNNICACILQNAHALTSEYNGSKMHRRCDCTQLCTSTEFLFVLILAFLFCESETDKSINQLDFFSKKI